MNKKQKYSLDEGELISGQKWLKGKIQIIISKNANSFQEDIEALYILYFHDLWYFVSL